MQEHTCCDYPHDHIISLLHGGLQDPNSGGQIPKSILYNPSPVTQIVVEYLLIDVPVSVGEGFYQPGSEGEGIITNKEVLIFWPVVNE